MESALNIANYMLSKKVLTPKQVQKLLYYAYSLYLVKYNDKYEENNMNRLFNDKIEAWKHGPVVRDVYDYIKVVAFSYELVSCKGDIRLQDTRTENFINKILNVYGQYSGYELEKMTHNEPPWQIAIEKGWNQQITDRSIYEYFSKKYKISN